MRIVAIATLVALGVVSATSTIAEAQPRRSQWDSKGWVMLGEQTVDYAKKKRGNRDGSDTDRIMVGRYEGTFSKLQLVVDDSDLVLNSMKIVFGDNTEYNPKLAFEFKDGQRTRAFDLPPATRGVIKYIDLDYKNAGRRDGERARVQVWGFQTSAPRQPPPRYQWDTNGWQMLGEQAVDYARKRRGNRDGSDTDRVMVGRYEGRFDKLQLVVDDSDLTLISMRVVFGDNSEWRPTNMAYEFREGQRSRAIDLPGDNRLIQYIDLDYKNSGARDGQKARVQVWGRKAVQVQPRRYTWNNQGWQLLGEQTVDYAERRRGRRGNRGQSDTDRITVGRYEGAFSRLQLVVDDSDMTLEAMKIVFGDNTEFNPNLAYEFKEGQRSRAFDLPRGARVIQYIDLTYRNSGQRDGLKARVQVWGEKAAVAQPPPPKRYTWDTNGWQMLGEETVDYAERRRGRRGGGGGASDTDRIQVGRYEGAFSKLQLVVDDSDMTLEGMRIVFGDNTEYNPKLAYEFKEGARTRAIDLPPSAVVIQYIELTYRNSGQRDGQKARVQVWGLKTGNPNRPRGRR